MSIGITNISKEQPFSRLPMDVFIYGPIIARTVCRPPFL